MRQSRTEPSPGQVKRQLLRQAVEENVHVRRGTRGRGRRPLRGRHRSLAFAVGVGILAVAVYLVPRSLSHEGPPGEVGLPDGLLAPAALPIALPDLGGGEESTVMLTATAPLDSSVLPLSIRRIVVDPGHGGRDVGTETPDGLYEKDLALDIALRLRDLLAEPGGFEVVMTREQDETVSLKDRARIANEARADLFISIHVNWFEPRTLSGVETYILGTTTDPYLVELASRENRESGYAMADARRLLDGIYLNLRTDQSRELATAVQRSLYQTLRHTSPNLKNRGVKSAPFIVLVATDMPAILAEVSSLSNRREAELLATTTYRREIAEALREGVESYTMSLSQEGARGS